MRLKGVGLVIPKGGKQNFSQFLEKKNKRKKKEKQKNEYVAWCHVCM